jgi:hypothetical protein
MALEPVLDPSTGDLRLPDGRLGRDVTRAAFLSSRLKQTIKNTSDADPWTASYDLGERSLSGVSLALQVSFAGERLAGYTLVDVAPRFGSSWDDWTEQKQLARRDSHDGWLISQLGPPSSRALGDELHYELSWGTVWSTFDRRGGGSSIGVSFLESEPGQDLRGLLRATDVDDLSVLSRWWQGRSSLQRRDFRILAEAFATTQHAFARECQIRKLSPYARFDDTALALGLRSLADPSLGVRYRGCGLLGHGRRREALPALRALGDEAATRAIRAIEKGLSFGLDDDPFYRFFPADDGSLPRGTFADQIDREVGGWLVERGFTVTFLFAHDFEAESDDVRVWAGWSPGRLGVAPGAVVNVTHRDELADTRPIPPGPGDVIEVVKRIREPIERLRK